MSATAAPVVVLPPEFSQWLVRTLDANTADAEMLAALAQTGGDPAAIFAFVRGFGYDLPAARSAARAAHSGARPATAWTDPAC